MTKIKRRFIAGATCPQCKALDSLQLYFENNVEKLSCVKCDYMQSQTDEETQKASKSDAGVIGVFKP